MAVAPRLIARPTRVWRVMLAREYCFAHVKAACRLLKIVTIEESAPQQERAQCALGTIGRELDSLLKGLHHLLCGPARRNLGNGSSLGQAFRHDTNIEMQPCECEWRCARTLNELVQDVQRVGHTVVVVEQ